MRRVGRRLSGGSTEDDWKCRGSKATSLVEELTEDVARGSENDACKFCLNVARSGAVAWGKVASGQPSRSGVFSVSTDEETFGGFCFSALSRVQVDTQATNSHRKAIGKNAANNLLTGNCGINNLRIIHIRIVQSYLIAPISDA